MQLRPHQTKAVQAMFRHSKGQIIVPTGGGKTMCMIDDAMNEFDPLASDSADLKEKIELALDPKTTIEQIENGDL